MHTITLDTHADFAAWRAQARDMCAARVHPSQLRFIPPDREEVLLNFGVLGLREERRKVVASPEFMERAERVVCHRDPERYDRLYGLLWRLQDQPSLMRNTVDDDVRWMVEADKSVRRDRHKMHAFVRFRKVGETPEGRERFMAWFEPDNYIVDLATPFFTRRFPNMDWAIVTPYRTADLGRRGAAVRGGRHPRRRARRGRGRGSVERPITGPSSIHPGSRFRPCARKCPRNTGTTCRRRRLFLH